MSVRTRLLAIVLLALVAALAAATVGFNVLLSQASASDARSLLRERASSELALIDTRAGRIQTTEAADDASGDSNVWIFEDRRLVEKPRRHSASDAAARSLAGGPERFLDVGSSDERLYAVPIQSRSGRLGTLVVGLSVVPYEQTRDSALIGSAVFAATLLAIVGVAVYLLLRAALRPVLQMTAQAEAWSEHDLDRRFALGEPHDELTRLGATLDGLLDRLAASLRHERRFSAELSHELRTPLAKLAAEAELALRRERGGSEYRAALEVVLENASQLARIVDALVAAAQQEAGPRGVSDGVTTAHDVAAACSGLAAEHAVTVEVSEPDGPVRVGVDGDLVERILQPVVENACRYGRRRVSIAVARRGAGAEFVVEDDGPGVTPDELEAIFEPAGRGTAGRAAGAGAGLGFALARRLARAASGDVEAAPDRNGGRFVVRLPAA
jgi:two-component system, OmpR family, sensor kinase